MCTENIDGLRSCETKDDAVNLYKKTIDWALEKGYPALSFIREEFGNCEHLGLFVDKEFHGEVLDQHQCYVFHNCKGYIRVDLNVSKSIIPMLYFANGCDIAVGRADSPHTMPIRVPLYIYGENIIKAQDDEDIIFTRKGGAR